MQPDHLGAELDRFSEQFCVRRQRNMQAGTHEIGLEASRERRMRHHGGDVGHHILGLDRLPVNLREMREQRRLDVRLRRRAVAPERINAPTASRGSDAGRG